MEFIRDSCIRIPIDDAKGKWWFEQTVLDLRRKDTQTNYAQDGVETTKYYYAKDMVRRDLMIPRYYPLKGFDYKLRVESTTGEDIDVNSLITIRNARQAESVDYLTRSNNGILCLSPGEGKTVVSIHTICTLKKKAIVFVHKDSLADQWIERFKEFTDIDVNRIARLRTAKFVDHITNYPIVIATVQTFCRCIDAYEDFYNLIRKANFGVAFWDECHTSVSAEQFSKSSLYLPCRRTFGLSATPTRLDGNTDIMNYHLGPVYIPFADGIDTIPPKVILIQFDHGVMGKDSEAWVMHNTQYDKNNKVKPFFDMTRYLTKLCKSKVYKEKIKMIMLQICKSDRKSLFLATRIDILDEAAKICPNKSEVGFFIPRSGKERDNELKKRLVFSTYGSARDGTDKKELDCLVLGTPTSNLEQAIGRVVRFAKNKQQPVVFDLVDTGYDQFIDRAKKRIEFYLSKGWKVEEVHLK